MHRRIPCPIGIFRSNFSILARHECIIAGGCGVVVLRAVRVPIVIVIGAVVQVRSGDRVPGRGDVFCLLRRGLHQTCAAVGREGHHGEVVILPAIGIVPLKD